MERREEDNGDDVCPEQMSKDISFFRKFPSYADFYCVPNSDHICGFWRSWNFWGPALVILHHWMEILTSRWCYNCKHIHVKTTHKHQYQHTPAETTLLNAGNICKVNRTTALNYTQEAFEHHTWHLHESVTCSKRCSLNVSDVIYLALPTD